MSAWWDAPGSESRIQRDLQPFQEMLDLIGKPVRITLDWDDPDAVVEGVLLSLTDDGECTYRATDDNQVWSGWPTLQVEAL